MLVNGWGFVCAGLKREKLTALAVCALVTCGTSVALAQTRTNVDWVVNTVDAGFDPVSAGADVEYAIQVDNNGSAVAPATTILLDVPGTTELTSITGDFSGCTMGGNPVSFPLNGPAMVTCDVPSIPATTTPATNVDAVVTLRTLQQGLIVLGASVPVTGDDLTTNNAATEETTVAAGSDLELSLGVVGAVGSGDFIDFDITVLNNGPDTASSFVIDFPIPTGVSNLTGAGGASLPAGCSINVTTVRCTVTGPVAQNASVVRSFQGQVSAAGGSAITSSASVLNAAPSDPINTNNTATANTQVNDGTDVAVEITRPGTNDLVIGQSVRFTVASSYTGNPPSGLEIETTIPANFTVDSVSTTDGWVCDPLTAARVLRCTRPNPTGQGIDLPLGNIFIDTTAAIGGTADVETVISATSPVETNFANNRDSLAETIQAPTVDLRANKTGPNPATAVEGETIRYTISATNLGTAGFVGTVRMVDDLPAGLSVAAVQENGWSCTPNTNVVGPQAITCERIYTSGAPLEANATTPAVVLNAVVQSGAPSSIVNSMTVSAPITNFTDNNTGNDTTTYNVTVEGVANSADLDVNQYAVLPTLPSGDIQTTYVELVNLGPGPSNNVRAGMTLTNLLNNSVGPTNAGLVSITPIAGSGVTPSCSSRTSGSTGRAVTCTLATLPVCTPGTPGTPPTGGTCPIVEVQFRPAGDPGQQSQTADIRSLETPDPDTSNRRATITYTLTGLADVSVAKNFTPDPVRAGQNITYVITASNLDNAQSTNTATDVTVTDDLPDGVVFISATPSEGTCGTQPTANTLTNSSQVICNLGPINNGAQETVTVVVRPTNAARGTTLRNAASVTTTTQETNLVNNATFVDSVVQPPVLDILINKDDSIDPVLVGQSTVYTLRVTNAGPSAAENVVVTDVLPDAIFAYRSHVVSSAGSCGTVPVPQVTPDPNPANRTLQCSFPTLAVGQSETIFVTMEAVAEGSIDNTVSISSDEIALNFDTEPDNNQTSETTTARRRADISVTSKTPSQNTLNLREPFDFVIRVQNNPTISGFDAANVVLSDTLPSGMVLTGTPVAVVDTGSITQNVCTPAVDNGSFSCSFGTASADAVILITAPVKVTTLSTQGETFVNTAQVSTTSFDSNPNNNEASGSVTVNASALSGLVYRDFNNSATPSTNGQDEARDTGIAGVTMTLTGTAVDGDTITETALTDGNGVYTFPFLPQGTYTLTRGAVNEPGLSTGQNTLGSVGGTLASGSQVTGISLPLGTTATGYDFAEIPGSETPAIALIKTASLSALSNPPQPGELVSYSFRITNTGNVPLTNVTLVDPVPGVTLTGTPIPSLAPGETNTTAYSATYALQAGDIGGQISNTATVTGTPPTGGDVSDVSGTTFTNDTPTTTNIPTFTPIPAIALNKTVDDSAIDDGAAAGDVLSYGFTITNTGNVPLYNVTVTDQLAGIVVTGTPIPVLDPGETNTTAYSATYTVGTADILNGEVVNDARVTGTYPQGSSSTVTDDDTETVEFLNIDAVPEVFPPFTDGGTTTTMLASDTVEGQPANLGNVTLTVLREDPGVTLDPVTTLITLAPGLPAGSYEVDYQICSIALPGLCDEATETVVQAARPSVETTKTQELADNGDGLTGVGDTIVYQITLQNTGNIALDNVTILDTLRDRAGGSLTLTSGPDFISSSAGSPEGELAQGETATYAATFVINDQAVAAGGTENTADGGGFTVPLSGVPQIPERVNDISDDGDDTDGNTEDDPTVLTLNSDEEPVQPSPDPVTGLTLAKTTTKDVVRRGEVVPYTVTITNAQDIAVGPVTLVDTLPSGLAFVTGSASLTPSTVTAGQITWTGITLPAQGSLEVSLSARVLSGARSGEHINRAGVFDPITGDPLTDEATATVRLLPEAVFDCGEVIGKVFVDLNGDGYQNDPDGRDGSITDQTYAGGKGAALPKTEEGIPNVRLVTVDGSIITTDQYGRYSVPCAMLPENTGSNFILKLDDRTLPTGYRVTTENPRVVRLTPGMMTELNFGATIGRVVRVDLGAAAFGLTSDGKVVLSPALKRGIAALLPRLDGPTETLRLTFHVHQNADADDIKTARRMMQATAAHIKREWRKTGRSRLRVEETVARAGQ